MIDLLASAVEEPLADESIAAFKHEAFAAILDEEDGRLTAEPELVPGLRAEIAGA